MGEKGTGSQMSRREELILMLEKELDVLEKGGYGTPSGQPPQPAKIFQDSLACINHWLVPGRTPDVCNGCVLLDFVPEDCRQKPHACRFIPLNSRGETVDSLSHLEDQDRLQEAVRGWLQSTIAKLESQPPTEAEEDAAPPAY